MDTLGSGVHSTAAQKGEVDERTPGSFPRDNEVSGGAMTGIDQPHIGNKPVPSSHHDDLGGTLNDPLIQGKQHNVLHKKNDPRGQTTDFTRGHAHKDSGVGMNDYPTEHSSRGNATYSGLGGAERDGKHDAPTTLGAASDSARPIAVPPNQLGGDRSGQKTEEAFGGPELGSHKSEHAPLTATGGIPQSSSNNTYTTDSTSRYSGPGAQETHHSSIPALGVGAGSNILASHEPKNREMSSNQQPGLDKEEPYWGDLPQGMGTYNTVTGHGSKEDPSSQHRAIPLTGNEAAAPNSNTRENQPQHTGIYNTVTGHGSSEENASRAHHEHGPTESVGTSSHPGIGSDSKLASGAGVDQSHVPAADNSNEKHSKDTKHAAEAGAAGLGIGAVAKKLFHRNKDEEDQQTPRHDEKHTTHHHHETKHETKPHHGHSSTAVQPESEIAKPSKHQSPMAHAESQELARDRDHHGASGLASIGAGGAAAYGASKLENEKRDNQNVESSMQGTTGTSTNPSGLSGSHPSTVHDVTSTGQTGLKSSEQGMLNTTHLSGQHPSTTSNTSTSDNHPAMASHISNAPQSSYQSGADTTTQMPAHESHTRDAAGGLAGAGIAAGAIYGTSKLADDHSHRNERDSGLMTDPSAQHGGHSAHSKSNDAPYNVLASGTPSGMNDDGSQGHTMDRSTKPGNQSGHMTSGEAPYNVLASGTPSGVHGHDETSRAANAAGSNAKVTVPAAASSSADDGPYNVLGSGTPSGVQIGSHSTQHQPSKTAHEADLGHHVGQPNRDSKPVAAAAAGTGAVAGIAAEKGLDSGNDESKLTHKCNKCGEENDVTHLLQRKANTARMNQL